MKDMEDRIIDIQEILECTASNVELLIEKYSQFYRTVPHSPQKRISRYGSDVAKSDSIVQALQDKEREISLYRKKALALREKVRGTIALVRSEVQ